MSFKVEKRRGQIPHSSKFCSPPPPYSNGSSDEIAVSDLTTQYKG